MTPHHQHAAAAPVPAPTHSFFEHLQVYFSEQDFMPHGHCYLWKPGLVSLHVISDILIGLAYISISITLYVLVKRIKIQFDRIVLSFGVFIGACGLTHFMEVWNLWNADYWSSAWVKVITAAASVSTGIYLIKLRHPLIRVAEAAKLSEQRRLDLEALTEDLEERVVERTKELTAAVNTRDQFLSIASHELKTPLTSLQIHTQLLSKKLNQHGKVDLDHEQAMKFLKMVESQNKRLERLIEDMLDVSNIQRGKLDLNKVPTNICLVVTDFVERFKPHFENKAQLSLETCEDALVDLDVFRFEQVLHNLLNNARKYAPASPVVVKVLRNKGSVIISVHDQGKGITQEKQHKIFERYERAASQNDPSGLGLGLYISRHIIEAHGGKIWVESIPEKGTTFFVSIPLSDK